MTGTDTAGGRYWFGEGRYQASYKQLRKALVPRIGRAKTKAGELLRIIGNYHYDYMNNGGCNLMEDHFREEGRRFLGRLPLHNARIQELGKRMIVGAAKPADLDELIDWAILYAKRFSRIPDKRASAKSKNRTRRKRAGRSV